MTKLDAVVGGELDGGYRVRDDNVNRNEIKKDWKHGEDKEDVDKVAGKKETKRKSFWQEYREWWGTKEKKVFCIKEDVSLIVFKLQYMSERSQLHSQADDFS